MGSLSHGAMAMRSTRTLAGGGLMAAAGATMLLARPAADAAAPLPFERLALRIEVNATDGDAGIVFDAASSRPLRQLQLEDPRGHVLFRSQADDPQGIGITDLFWEALEVLLEDALEAYPEGQYRASGRTMDGALVRGVAALSHRVLAAPRILSPAPGAQVGVNELVLSWEPDPRARGYQLQLEELASERATTLDLPPDSTSFAVPAALLAAHRDYKLSVGALAENGNVTVTEVEFRAVP